MWSLLNTPTSDPGIWPYLAPVRRVTVVRVMFHSWHGTVQLPNPLYSKCSVSMLLKTSKDMRLMFVRFVSAPLNTHFALWLASRFRGSRTDTMEAAILHLLGLSLDGCCPDHQVFPGQVFVNPHQTDAEH